MGCAGARRFRRPAVYAIGYLAAAFYGEYLRCLTTLTTSGPQTLCRTHRLEKAAEGVVVLEAFAEERCKDGAGDRLPGDLAAALAPT